MTYVEMGLPEKVDKDVYKIQIKETDTNSIFTVGVSVFIVGADYKVTDYKVISFSGDVPQDYQSASVAAVMILKDYLKVLK